MPLASPRCSFIGGTHPSSLPGNEVVALVRVHVANIELFPPERARGRAHYVCLLPDQNFFWPEYENSCIFRASCHKDVLVFMLFYHRKKFQSWGVRAERSREELRSAHLLGSCASGMAGSKILTHMPKTTGHAPSGHKTE